jgi:hypothetical protein
MEEISRISICMGVFRYWKQGRGTMHRIERMKVVLCLFACMVVLPVVSAEERARGIYIDLGLGLGSIRYLGGNTKAIADDFNRTAETRTTFDMSMLTIGGTLRDNLYLVGSVAGVGDGYFDAKMNQNQITIAMFGLGVRYYPMASKKHLQLGLDLGASVTQITYSEQMNKADVMSSVGFSERASIGWDFDSTLTGLALMVGGDVMLNVIEGDASVSYALFVKFVFK